VDEFCAFADGMSRMQGTVKCCRGLRCERNQRRIFVERSFHALQRRIHNGWNDLYDSPVVPAARGTAGGHWSVSVVSDSAHERIRSRGGPWRSRIRTRLKAALFFGVFSNELPCAIRPFSGPARPTSDFRFWPGLAELRVHDIIIM
jgi:hypothetical protein